MCHLERSGNKSPIFEKMLLESMGGSVRRPVRGTARGIWSVERGRVGWKSRVAGGRNTCGASGGRRGRSGSVEIEKSGPVGECRRGGCANPLEAGGLTPPLPEKRGIPSFDRSRNGRKAGFFRPAEAGCIMVNRIFSPSRSRKRNERGFVHLQELFENYQSLSGRFS